MTPTTPHVMARERTPPMFRPGNQANLEPATPANFAATQNMLPGMGRVQSGNDPTNHGLGPDDAEFARIAKTEERRRAKARARAKSVLGRLDRQIQETKAILDRAAARGQELPRRAAQKLNALQAQRQWLMRMARAERRQSQAINTMPYHRGAKVIPSVFSPPTPDPLQYEPIGISRESNRAKILAMQANIQPVTQMQGIGALAPQPLVLAGLVVGGLWFINKSRGL